MARTAAKTGGRPGSSAARGGARGPADAPPPSKSVSQSGGIGAQRSLALKWPAILGGLAVAYVASVAMGVLMARAGLAGNLALFPFVQFLALFCGGYVAGRWAGRGSGEKRPSGFLQGVAVAIGFIVVWAAQNAILEARLVDEYGPLALPRMNIPGILLGDFLNLSAAAFGGWIAESKRG